ncbi:MAG: guanylate kinase, partial [Actinomycetota bacterium]|nr:guanylate kinase [Actinomycetota bacterium]
GPGGVGKGTVASMLCQRNEWLALSRSWTTRQRRDGESEDAYVFVDQAHFKAAVEADGFLEWAWFLDNLYGTPLPGAEYVGCDKHILLEIDVQGAAQVRERVPSAVIVVLEPPSQEELRRRLQGRGDDNAHVAARLRLAAEEIKAALSIGARSVVNDDLDHAVSAVAEIFRTAVQERCGSA